MSTQVNAPVVGNGPVGPAKKQRTGFGHIGAQYSLPIILVGIAALFSLLSIWLPKLKYFPTWDNLTSLLQSNSVIVILSLGAALPLIVGAFDLSVAANSTLAGVLAAGLFQKFGLNEWVALLLALAASCLIGLINGLLVAKGQIDAFVATLGTSVLIAGAATWFGGGQTFASIPASFKYIGQGKLLGIPVPVYFFVVIAIIAYYVLNMTPFGRNLYAVGGSREASRLSGLNVPRLTILAFVIAGLLAGIAGFLAMCIVGQGTPADAGRLLPAFAAVFLGTTSYKLGVFTVQGTVTAVFVIAILNNGLTYLGAPPFLPPIVTGIALITAALFSRYFKSRTLRGSAR